MVKVLHDINKGMKDVVRSDDSMKSSVVKTAQYWYWWKT